jgi:glutamate-1-semialdehyde 2,1-aminomutase
MDELAPRGKIYQAGTLSGNPLAVAAGLKTVEILERDYPYPRLEELGQRVAEIINTAAASKGLPFRCAQFGGVFTVFFTGQPVKNLADAKQCDTQAYAQHFHSLLNRGYYLPPSQFEVGFISTAHSDEEVSAFAHAVVK